MDTPKRKYLENIINDDVSSNTNFIVSFIQDKGTPNSLTKLFDALSNTDNDSVNFYEEWAVRLGQLEVRPILLKKLSIS